MKANWIDIATFSQTAHLNEESVYLLIEKEELEAKEENGKMYVNTNSISGDSSEMIPQMVKDITKRGENVIVESQFVEKTIGTILSLHEKVIGSKDETIDALKDENSFVKESVLSMQELYDEDRETIETLTQQLKMAQDEVRFLKRKYKLMWGKVIDDYATNGE